MSESTAAIQRTVGGRFLLMAEIERRPTAIIYRAQDQSLGDREVAVKIFQDSPGDRNDLQLAFEAEVNKLRNASHPSLVPIIQGGIDDGLLFLAMEFVPGINLRQLLRDQNGSPMAFDSASQIIAELAAGLAEIHEQEIVHGHLDSRAVLFKGEEPRLAGYFPKAIEEIQKQSTSAGRILSEPFYISPEQLSGAAPVDGRADVYSLSILLFEMVTGRRPFEAGSAMQAAMMRISEPAPSPRRFNSEISPLLEAAIMKGLAKDPRHRFANANEFREALLAASGISKNPFAAMASQQPERMTTSTIAVSMSADAIREMLKGHNPAVTPATASSAGTLPDAAATAMSFQAVTPESIPASFMLVSGSDRGKRFQMSRQQMIVGSDPTCDIHVKEKIPSRFALFLHRGSDFYVAPLSSEPVKINGEAIKGEEQKLERGDQIQLGNSQLRFIMPGEIFTLRDDVADRVIDRPRSRAGMFMLAAVALTAALAVGAFTLYQQRAEQARLVAARKRAQIEQKKEERIARLRQEADEFMRAGALRAPAGANAEERYREILAESPDDTTAKRKLQEIEERSRRQAEDAERRKQLAGRLAELKADADKYFDQRQYVSPPGRNARETYQEMLKIDPEDAHARARVAEIENKMKELLDSVRDRLILARELKEQGKYIEPRGENAGEILQGILDVDPKNREAREMLYDMAARSMFSGEIAKGMANLDEMRKAFLVAQTLGVDPAYIERQTKGTEIMARSKGSVFIVDTGAKEDDLPKNNENYLETSEIHKRIAKLKLDAKLSGKSSERTYIEMRR